MNIARLKRPRPSLGAYSGAQFEQIQMGHCGEWLLSDFWWPATDRKVRSVRSRSSGWGRMPFLGQDTMCGFSQQVRQRGGGEEQGCAEPFQLSAGSFRRRGRSCKPVRSDIPASAGHAPSSDIADATAPSLTLCGHWQHIDRT